MTSMLPRRLRGMPRDERRQRIDYVGGGARWNSRSRAMDTA